LHDDAGSFVLILCRQQRTAAPGRLRGLCVESARAALIYLLVLAVRYLRGRGSAMARRARREIRQLKMSFTY
jgi:hypothetical protein